jgi:hypothetical protein
VPLLAVPDVVMAVAARPAATRQALPATARLRLTWPRQPTSRIPVEEVTQAPEAAVAVVETTQAPEAAVAVVETTQAPEAAVAWVESAEAPEAAVAWVESAEAPEAAVAWVESAEAPEAAVEVVAASDPMPPPMCGLSMLLAPAARTRNVHRRPPSVWAIAAQNVPRMQTA